MKVIIAGSRTITDPNVVVDFIIEVVLKHELDITEVVCGGARGVDEIGYRFGKTMNLPVKVFQALWDTFGKSAGPRRNRAMAEYADALILVWDGKSRGSANMKSEAQKCGLTIYEKIIGGTA
jgi:hypothetical protein